MEQIKRRAEEATAKRRAREERERREAEELKTTLEAIANMEAKEIEKREKLRTAKETQRKKQVHWRYADFRAKLDEIYEFQACWVDGEHGDDRDHLEKKKKKTMESLRLRHDAKMRQLRTSLTARIEEREEEWERDWQEHMANEEQAEADYEIQLDEMLGSEESGQSRKKELLMAHQFKHEHGRGECTKSRDDELERLRWVLDEEVAIEQELMDAQKVRIEESFTVQQYELQLKARSEARWLELVKLERSRLLNKILDVELADEIIDDDDERWDQIIVKEEIGDAGPSRF